MKLPKEKSPPSTGDSSSRNFLIRLDEICNEKRPVDGEVLRGRKVKHLKTQRIDLVLKNGSEIVKLLTKTENLCLTKKTMWHRMKVFLF